MFTKRFCGKSLLANSIIIIVHIFSLSQRNIQVYQQSLFWCICMPLYVAKIFLQVKLLCKYFFQAALSYRESHLEWFVMANNQNCLPIISLWLPEGGVMQFWFHMCNFLHQKVFPMPTLYSNKILTCFDISSALMGEGNLFWIWQAG